MNKSDGTCCEGFSIDLWTELVSQMNKRLARGETPYTFWDGKTRDGTFMATASVTELLNAVRHGAVASADSAGATRADVAIAAITITPKRGMEFSFTQSYFDSGLRIMIRADEEAGAANILSQIFSVELLKLVGVLILVILLAAHIIWLLERKRNPDHFNKGYVKGVFDAIWWAAVTLTTVGYGDRVPRGVMGRMFALFWMFSGLVFISFFTASVTSTLTANRLQSGVSSLRDLRGKVVATTQGSAAETLLRERGFSGDKLKTFKLINDAYLALREGSIDAVVYDWPSLIHYAKNHGDGAFEVVGEVFDEQHYGIALPRGSPCKEIINSAYYALQRDQRLKALRKKWVSLAK